MVKIKKGDKVKIVKLGADIKSDEDLFVGKVGTVISENMTDVYKVSFNEEIHGKLLKTYYYDDTYPNVTHLFSDEIKLYVSIKDILKAIKVNK